MYTAADVITAALAGVLVILLGLIAVRAWRRSRILPVERERQRRSWLASHGKMGDAILLEIHENLLEYSYAVHGVAYTASQDVSALKALLPADISSRGHVLVKYDSRNAANSIVVAEDWNGLQSAALGSAQPVPRV